MGKEIWKDVKGYEGIYAISNYGNVKSYDRQVWGGKGYRLSKGRKLKPQDNGSGYKFIGLFINKKKEKKYIHRLVAEMFIPNPGNLPFVNHIDSNPANNNMSNLEWVTPKGNIRHAIKKGRFDNSFKMTNKKFEIDRESKLRAVVGTCIKTNKKVYFKSIQEAGRKFNGRAGDICKVCKGERKTAQGYRWEYHDTGGKTNVGG